MSTYLVARGIRLLYTHWVMMDLDVKMIYSEGLDL
jgi:hypothetical protein